MKEKVEQILSHKPSVFINRSIVYHSAILLVRTPLYKNSPLYWIPLCTEFPSVLNSPLYWIPLYIELPSILNSSQYWTPLYNEFPSILDRQFSSGTRAIIACSSLGSRHWSCFPLTHLVLTPLLSWYTALRVALCVIVWYSMHCTHVSQYALYPFDRQLIYNYPEQLFADAGVMAIEHADFEGVERLALVTGKSATGASLFCCKTVQFDK